MQQHPMQKKHGKSCYLKHLGQPPILQMSNDLVTEILWKLILLQFGFWSPN